MSMVAKTLVGDQKKNGQVKRHIFSADFMTKMSHQPIRWSVQQNEREVLPKHVGYNIGECDFIFGPTVFDHHWFCYVIEPRSLRFYVLDSLVEYTRFMKEQEGKTPKARSQKSTGIDPKQFAARSIVCF